MYDNFIFYFFLNKHGNEILFGDFNYNASLEIFRLLWPNFNNFKMFIRR